MTEIIDLRDGDAVTLRPCPPWCTQSRHFGDNEAVYAEDGFHHYGRLSRCRPPTGCLPATIPSRW